MTIVSSKQDPEALTFVIVAEYAAPPSRVWQVWADPRQLERWWGPPTWPATFEQHDVVAGGGSRYYMTGPDESGVPNPQMPTIRGRVELEEIAAGTRMTVTSQFATVEQMEQLVQMGMVEGMTLAMGQIDDVLAAA